MVTVVTGLTALRMLAIEGASVIAGFIQDDNLILTRRDGTPINAGNVRGPQGIQGVPGSITVSPAGGDLAGSYPNPTIASTLKDAAAAVASMRSLGTGSLQAAAGDHSHVGLRDSGWVDFTPGRGESPFAGLGVDRAQARKIGQMVHVRFAKTTTASMDRTTSTSGNFPNTLVLGVNSVPSWACPDSYSVHGQARLADSPTTVVLGTDGSVVWTGGFPRNYASGSTLTADFVFITNRSTPA